MSTAELPLASDLLETAIRALDPDVVVVTVHGEVDDHSVVEFADAIDAGLRPTALVTVLDVTGLTRLASRGSTVLADAARAARLRHVSLRLVGVQPPVQRALDAADLGRTFDCYPSVDAAVRHRPLTDDS